MKYSDIEEGMMLKHITDGITHRPHKLVVISKARPDCGLNLDTDSTIYCEWMSVNGKFHSKSFRPIHLEKW